MKLGTKSNLISAYSALFTVALGILIYDYVRRSSTTEERPIAQAQPAQEQVAKAKPSRLAAR